MYQKKLEKDIRCPLEYGLSVFGGKWKSRIICVLAAKETLRYSSCSCLWAGCLASTRSGCIKR